MEKKISKIKACLVFSIAIAIITGFSVLFNAETRFDVKGSSENLEGEKILYVGGNGPNNYTKIQAAANDANAGDTVFVFAESSPYQENIDIQKSINLIGENRLSTIIQGNGSGDVIHIFADWVNVTGFTIIGSGNKSNDAGVEIQSQYTTISDNIIKFNMYHGIFLNYASHNSILGNIIENNSNNNIYLSNSNNNFIHNNTCRNTLNYHGISLSSSNNNTIMNTTCTNNKNQGIGLWSSNNNHLANNICQQNGGNGIYLSKANTTQILSNTVLDNKAHGIRIISSQGNIIAGNTVSASTQNNIYLENTTNSIIRDNTCTQSTSYHGILFTAQSNNNTIMNNTVIQNHFQGIYILDSNDNHITYNTLQQNEQNGIYLSKANTNQILDNTVLDNKVHGIKTVSSQDNIIAGNTASTNNQTGIYLENTTNSIIRDNTCTQSTGWHGICLTIQSNNNTITNNTVTQNHFQGIIIVDSNDNHITYNTLQQNEQNGIYLSKANTNQILGNTVLDNKAHGIRIISSQGNIIAGNTVSASTQNNIYLENTTNSIIRDNTCTQSTSYHGILFTAQSNNNTIMNNTVIQNHFQGIYILDSNDNHITRNTCQQNGEYGVYLRNIANTIIDYNKCIKNRGGMTLRSSINNNVMGNLIMKNMENGLILNNSTGNTIYHNNLIYNNQDAQDDKYNTWNLGLPEGGNYWWVFDEPHEGAYDKNTDNIIDTAYMIDDGNNRDRYPLKKPWNITINLPPSCSATYKINSRDTLLIVTLSLRASDVDGSIVSWSFDVNNDGIIDYQDNGNPPKSLKHTYQTVENYTARFIVNDNQGESYTSLLTIDISLKGPSCSLSTSSVTSGHVPLTITMLPTVYDNGGSIASWTLDMNGNGIPEYSGKGTPPSILHHTFYSKGTYTATLTVIDQDGLNSTSEISITVLKSPVPINQFPIATFYYSPHSPVKTDVLISFVDSSNDPDGNIVNWTWNLGDGAIMYGKQTTHSYQEEGSYNIILNVLDNKGATGSYTQKITVEKKGDGGGIPGFEMILFFAAIGLVLIIEKRRQSNY